MPGFRRVFGRLRGDAARGVDDELRLHLAMKAEDLHTDGLEPAEAAREARRRFGDVRAIRRECRRLQAEVEGRRRRGDFMDALLQDIRFACRTLLRNPGFSVVAIVTLALGIGANTAIFSIVNGLMLRSLPGIESPEGLVEISQGDGDDFVSISHPVFRHVQASSTTLDDIAAFDVVSMAMAGEGEPQVYFGLQVTGNYFDVLGARPAAGRFFAADRRFHPGVEDAVVISHALWEARYGRDPEILGTTVVLNGYPAQIIGVAPPGFGGHMVAAKADIFVPIGMPAPEMHRADSLAGNRNGMLETVGRRAPDASIEAVRAEVAALADAFIQAEEGPGASYPLQTTPYGAVPGSVRSGATLFFAILMGIVGLLLVITCVNVANMLLSRASARRKEIAVRLSMGASRGRLVRQLLTESLLLSAFASIAGTLVAVWLTGLLTAFKPPVLPFPGMRLELDFGLDARVLVFAAAITGVTALVFGLVPALRATRPALVPALKDASGFGGDGRSRLRALLVVGQMATTIVLLLGSGLFLRALQSAQSVETGFHTAGVHVGGFDLGLNGYDGVRTEAFYADLLAESARIPGVEAAALAGKLPLAGASSSTITVPGYERTDDVPGYNLHNQSVSRDYFRTLSLPLLRGRTFTDADGAEAEMVAVINETMAERFWGGDRAVGSSFVLFGNPVRIIGVVADARYHSLVEDTPLFAYFSHRQRPRTDMYLHLGIAEDAEPAAAWSAVRAAVARLDPEVPFVSTAPLDEALQIFWFPQLLAAWITGVVGTFGLLLGAVGIYGVTAYAASRRLREIGVRIALGAGARDVRWMMVRQGMVAPAVGLTIGVALAAIASRLLGSFLVGVSPLDPVAFATAVAVLASVALLATLIPARRAARVDPVVTLKAD